MVSLSFLLVKSTFPRACLMRGVSSIKTTQREVHKNITDFWHCPVQQKTPSFLDNPSHHPRHPSPPKSQLGLQWSELHAGKVPRGLPYLVLLCKITRRCKNVSRTKCVCYLTWFVCERKRKPRYLSQRRFEETMLQQDVPFEGVFGCCPDCLVQIMVTVQTRWW